MSIEAVLSGEQQWHVECGDCRGLWSRIPDHVVDLVFADPPFNWDMKYDGWDDGMPEVDYREFLHLFMRRAYLATKLHGSLWVSIPYELSPQNVKIARLRLTFPLSQRYLWRSRLAQSGRGKFLRSYTDLLHFAHEGYTWNPDAVLVESDRASKYGDKRTWKQENTTPGKRLPFDVWGIPSDGPNWGRIQGGNKERRPQHPNQLPEKLLERVILSTSNPGDLVLDPFTGSGTTGVVAVALGRRFIGFEISEKFAASARERIEAGAVRI